MANRILRDWTQSENINGISESAEVFFTRLIMKADDYGCFYGNLKLIKSALYPLKDISHDQIKKSIEECIDNNLILLYVVDNKDYIKIFNFGQRLRIMKSKFPQPNDSGVQTDDGDRPLETKRSRNEVEDETKGNEKEKAIVFFDEDYQLEFTIENGEKIYGYEYQRKSGGMSDHAIKTHCIDNNLKYPKDGQ